MIAVTKDIAAIARHVLDWLAWSLLLLPSACVATDLFGGGSPGWVMMQRAKRSDHATNGRAGH